MLLCACDASLAHAAGEPPAAQQAARSASSPLLPSGVFVQFGDGHGVGSAAVGAIWNLRGERPASRWEIYAEASLSRWQARGDYPGKAGVLAQVALVPVLRYRFDEGHSPWFVEGGIGAAATSSLYQTRNKRFSTAFNFADHVGLGYAFGPAQRDELVLRAEHFSNASIKHPNPGQNFLQLRYVRRFE